MFKDIYFFAFPTEREQQLKSITRYSMFEVMMYRSNLWQHTHRMLWMIEDTAGLANQLLSVDIEQVRVLALVHDDAEMITGDIQAGHKARMSAQELQTVNQQEEEAIEQLSAKFPKEVHGHSYRDLLTRVLKKDTIEAQLVSYFDKLDGFCESLHEVLGGNISFLRAIMFYTRMTANFSRKYPVLKPFLENKHTLTALNDRAFPNYVESRRYAQVNRPHTGSSVRIETDFPFYNMWRKVTMERGGEEGVRWLIEQRETIG